jgi:septal ring factor EnvC (AmiA/AmiB activator)
MDEGSSRSAILPPASAQTIPTTPAPAMPSLQTDLAAWEAVNQRLGTVDENLKMLDGRTRDIGDETQGLSKVIHSINNHLAVIRAQNDEILERQAEIFKRHAQLHNLTVKTLNQGLKNERRIQKLRRGLKRVHSFMQLMDVGEGLPDISGDLEDDDEEESPPT